MQPVFVLRASRCPLCPAGKNVHGQVGDGEYANSVTMPTAVVGSVSSWAAISAGGSHTCGLAAADGTAYCWGEALCVLKSTDTNL